jgi:uncharacterized protein (DUF885 family)
VNATAEFAALAARVVDDLLALDPVGATSLGDHRFDGTLPDLSADGVASAIRTIDDHVMQLDAIDDVALGVEDLVDLEILRARLMRAHFELTELRPYAWNPMVWNPGTAFNLLVTREFATLDERRSSVRHRLQAVPDHLADARAQLTDMPAIHVETAIGQLRGTASLVDDAVREMAEDDPSVDVAYRQVLAFADWLEDRLPAAQRSPRLGERLYSAALWHSLDDDVSSAELLEEAFLQLDLVNAQMRDAAAEYLGLARADDSSVRHVLDVIAERSPVSDDTVLRVVADALDRTTSFVREHDLIRVPDLDVQVIEMPEIHRGVAVAYCDAPGPLESAAVPTFVAVAPTPNGWSPERVASFYREYNAVQLHTLTVHEAMPGHVLQLAHAQHLSTPTTVRRFGRSGVFIEGWAVYAEEVMVEAGYAPGEGRSSWLELRLQQLKMQARGVINAILDISVHAEDMAEAEAVALMTGRGFQEEGEAVGKWRRALLTAGQLPTYFAGYRAMAGIAGDLRVLHGDWSARALHDLVLSKGSPAPRHLRTLLGI